MMLILVETEFEYFKSIFINPNNINAFVFIDFCLQFEFSDKVCNHFEVHDPNHKVYNISHTIDINLHSVMSFEVEQRKEPSENHQDLQDEKYCCID
jgi:hypothetical protein